jgi:hypothetical protein
MIFTTPPFRVNRSSVATYFDTTGTLQTAAANVARWQSGKPLIEAAAANQIRNNTMVGAAAGTPGTLPTNWAVAYTGGMTGLSYQVVGSGAESGIPYVDIRVYGTPNSSYAVSVSFDGQNAAAAALGQTWASSVYLRVVSGATTGIWQWQLVFGEDNAGGAYLAGGSATLSAPTNAALGTQRIAGTRTLTGTTTAYVYSYVLISVTGGTATDITLRFGAPQLELGATATSVIATAGSALTRAADVPIGWPGLYARAGFAATDLCAGQVVSA